MLHCVAGEKKPVQVGDRVTLECHAVLHERIMWSYTSPDDNNVRIVYWRNNIYNVERSRFSVDTPEKGVFDLVINNVTASDAGIYRCRENNGRYPGEACTEVVISASESNLTSYLSSLLQRLGDSLRDPAIERNSFRHTINTNACSTVEFSCYTNSLFALLFYVSKLNHAVLILGLIFVLELPHRSATTEDVLENLAQKLVWNLLVYQT